MIHPPFLIILNINAVPNIITTTKTLTTWSIEHTTSPSISPTVIFLVYNTFPVLLLIITFYAPNPNILLLSDIFVTNEYNAP